MQVDVALFLEPSPAAQLGGAQLNEHGNLDNGGVRRAQQVARGARGGARGEQVVQQQHARRDAGGLEQIGRHLQLRGAVLHLVRLGQQRARAVGVARRQLARLAHHDEAAAQLVRQRAAQREAARVNAGHVREVAAAVALRQAVHAVAQRARVRQQRAHVQEGDAGARPVGRALHERAHAGGGGDRDGDPFSSVSLNASGGGADASSGGGTGGGGADDDMVRGGGGGVWGWG
ncbi:Adenine phosphoribosyltransferase [Gracilaria domingensis]|nr:Adenine phosphoribosyltransferase [Gracilaria domingensis]